MQLLSDIINELVDNTQSITSPLLKTQVLASRIKNIELLEWIDKELGGYNSSVELPTYRVKTATLSMDYFDVGGQFREQPVPTHQLTTPFANLLTTIRFRQSIAVLETYVVSPRDEAILEEPVSAEQIAIIQQSIRKLGNPYRQIISFSKATPPTSAQEIVLAVRRMLLTFMLKLEEEFSTEVTIESLKEKRQQVTTILHQIIVTTGHGNVINTGNDANTQVDSYTSGLK